jgi:hypothetical protein
MIQWVQSPVPWDLKSRGTGRVYPGAGLNPHLVELYSQNQTDLYTSSNCLPTAA